MFNLEKIIMGRTSNHPLCFFLGGFASRQMATRGVAFWLHRLLPNGDPADFSGAVGAIGVLGNQDCKTSVRMC